jgi:hypothetical protein
MVLTGMDISMKFEIRNSSIKELKWTRIAMVSTR